MYIFCVSNHIHCISSCISNQNHILEYNGLNVTASSFAEKNKKIGSMHEDQSWEAQSGEKLDLQLICPCFNEAVCWEARIVKSECALYPHFNCVIPDLELWQIRGKSRHNGSLSQTLWSAFVLSVNLWVHCGMIWISLKSLFMSSCRLCNKVLMNWHHSCFLYWFHCESMYQNSITPNQMRRQLRRGVGAIVGFNNLTTWSVIPPENIQ